MCTYIKWVHDWSQSALYRAPISTALSLICPLSGFSKPLIENTTPSKSFLNGLVFRAFLAFLAVVPELVLGLGLELDFTSGLNALFLLLDGLFATLGDDDAILLFFTLVGVPRNHKGNSHLQESRHLYVIN